MLSHLWQDVKGVDADYIALLRSLLHQGRKGVAEVSRERRLPASRP